MLNVTEQDPAGHVFKHETCSDRKVNPCAFQD